MTALAWLGFALFFGFRALEKWRPWSLALAAVSCAMVVSNNFYGATALAMLFPALAWSVYITHLDRTMWLRAAAIAVLAYGLTAFWLVPSYIRITLDNMRFVSAEGNLWSRWVALGYAIAFVLLSDKFARGKVERAWLTFLLGSVGAFFVTSVGNQYLNFRVIGEPGRLFPELDLLIVLLAAELLRRLWSGGWARPAIRIGATAVLVVIALLPSWRFLLEPHSIFVRDPYPDRRVEFQLQDWMARNMPGSRALTSGSVRFWYNVWNDLPQIGGGSEQGLLNPRVLPPQWQIFLGPEVEMSVLWLKIMGADAALVHGRESREIYRDYVYPDKFRGVLPVLHDNGAGDVIYGVPRRWQSLARVVDRQMHAALPEIPGNGELSQLQAWHEVVEAGPDAPAEMQWQGTDAFTIRTTVAAGQSVWIAESYDANWRAESNGKPVPIRMDKLGFMVLDVPPGEHTVRASFPTPLSNLAGWAVTLFSLGCVAGLFWMGRRR
jgi:hypothetical protein